MRSSHTRTCSCETCGVFRCCSFHTALLRFGRVPRDRTFPAACILPSFPMLPIRRRRCSRGLEFGGRSFRMLPFALRGLPPRKRLRPRTRSIPSTCRSCTRPRMFAFASRFRRRHSASSPCRLRRLRTAARHNRSNLPMHPNDIPRSTSEFGFFRIRRRRTKLVRALRCRAYNRPRTHNARGPSCNP